MIRPQMFSGRIAGQVVFANDTGYGGISTKSWTVPPGVSFISAVVVGAFGRGYACILRGSTTLLDTSSSIPVQADGGGMYGHPVGVASKFGAGIRIMWGGGRSYPSNAGDV